MPAARFCLSFLVLLINLALAGLLWYAGPVSNHRAFGVLAQSAPDTLLLLGSNAALALFHAALKAF